MKQQYIKTFILSLICISYSIFSLNTNIIDTSFKLDKHYTLVPTSVNTDPDVKDFYEPYCNTKPTVVEFFSYACPGCMAAESDFKKYLSSKSSNVKFIRVPVVFNLGWDLVSKMYYANESLGITEDLHDMVFIWAQNTLRSRQAITKEKIKEFISKAFLSPGLINKLNGTSVDDYMQILDSTTVSRDKTKAFRLLKAYGIASTPSVVINNKYMVTLDKAKSMDNVIMIINELTKENTSC